MINKSQEIVIREFLKDSDIESCEKCETGMLRIKGHITFDKFEQLREIGQEMGFVYTLGKDGVLVIHD